MKKLCIFAHFDKDNIIDPYVVNYLLELQKVGFSIVFVSVSKIVDTSPIINIVSNIILRENIGYDFMSWQVGLNSVDNLDDYDELLFCNDSCYGPIYPLENIFSKMASGDIDAWGITDSNQLSYHIQSYFIVFKKKVFLSYAFKKFIDSISIEKNKEIIVEKYEVGLTNMLIENGFKIKAFIGYKDIINKVNISKIYRDKLNRIVKIFLNIIKHEGNSVQKIFFLADVIKKYIFRVFEFSVKDNSNVKFVAWRELIEAGDPFIKVMLLRDNPSNIPDLEDYNDLIQDANFNTSLIYNHLVRVKNNV